MAWRQTLADDGDAFLGLSAGISQMVCVSVGLVFILGQFNWTVDEIRHLLKGRAIIHDAETVERITRESVEKQQLRILSNDSNLGTYKMDNLCYADGDRELFRSGAHVEASGVRWRIKRSGLLRACAVHWTQWRNVCAMREAGVGIYHFEDRIYHHFALDDRILNPEDLIGACTNSVCMCDKEWGK